MAAFASKMAFLAAAFALALADELRDVCDVHEERDAQDTRERVPTFDALSSGLTCTWKEFISLVISMPVSQTSALSCKCSTWSNTES